MTVSSTSCRTSVVGSGAVSQAVPFTFPVDATSELTVTSRVTATGVESALAETTNYTVALNTDGTGTLTTVTAVAATSEIHIVRTTTRSQALDLEAGGTFSAENLEDGLDKLTRVATEHADGLKRSLHAPDTDDKDIHMVLPSSVDRASRYFKFDATGLPTATALATTGAASISAYGETLIAAATAAATRTILGLGAWYEAADYATFAAAITAIGATEGELHIRSALTVSTDVTVPITLALVFHKGGSLAIATGKTVTINGALIAGMYQIISGAGEIAVSGPAQGRGYAEWFGAKADGATDCAAAIADAVDHFDVVELLSGTYKTTAAIAVTNTTDKKSKKIVGQGAGSWNGTEPASHNTIVKPYGDGHCFTIATLGQTVIEGLSIQDGHGTRTAGAGIYAAITAGLPQIVVRDCFVYQMWDGIYLDSAIASRLENVVVRDTGNDGFVITANASAQPNMIVCDSCFAMYIARDGWRLANLFSCTFNGCGVDTCGRHGWYVYADAALAAGNVQGSVFNSCFSEDTGETTTGYGMYFVGTDAVVVNSPCVVTSAYDGIRISGAGTRAMTIIGPYTEGNVAFGIFVESGLANAELTIISARYGTSPGGMLSDTTGVATIISGQPRTSGYTVHSFRGSVEFNRDVIFSDAYHPAADIVVDDDAFVSYDDDIVIYN